jgi:hypothetical protein
VRAEAVQLESMATLYRGLGEGAAS